MGSLLDYWRRTRTPVQKFDTVGGASSYAMELTRRTPQVSLTRHGGTSGTLRVTLTWRMRTSDMMGPQVKGGSRSLRQALRNPLELFKPAEVVGHTQGVSSVDFDLACLYELKDGSRGALQPLGGLHGDFNEPPYIKLTGDDRFGTASGETVYINLDHADDIARVLIYVYIKDGSPAFARADAIISVVTPNGLNIEVGLTDPNPQARACSVAMIEHDRGELVVRREVRYVYGFQSEIDRLFGWGLSWGRTRTTG
ncbi:Tellurium resistance [Streptomyces sp. YIM 98790]|uniref:Tellurium resistance n=1 Tax=Streptomyces sp. YIM 98790 TaxID=2689077 RepID=UPI0014098902|nr:Tellurium resistance [Streptomyces sp. YIM 98790]